MSDEGDRLNDPLPSADKDAGLPDGVTVEEEWGVRYGESQRVHSKGTGWWAEQHAKQEAERTAHNATLTNYGQPRYATVVHRKVTRTFSATEWTSVLSPGGGRA